MRVGNDVAVEVHTKALALVFCAWVEIRTPKGFSLIEIAHIKARMRAGSVVDGWVECIRTAFEKTAAKKSNFTPNAKQRLRNCVDLLVTDPSLVRNKIAHGQWRQALNRENTNTNNDLTTRIQNLDAVKIDMWFDCQKILCEIVELLIESPNGAFMNSYWGMIERVETIPLERANWTVATKKTRLKPKRNIAE
ncbi:hypothetical protein EHI44_22125 [Rhizobium leguminosarum]|uniref:hypothetical protein n=1 Tax=Rhizobium leguminosarum TaxID=384 RepID=UPI000FEDBD5E|nr:hypothetical protein [Rhizobium leguminosarum]RWY83429.1 hypothetical protein EHI44_22125 [Rhizobium leguminosarum]